MKQVIKKYFECPSSLKVFIYFSTGVLYPVKNTIPVAYISPYFSYCIHNAVIVCSVKKLKQNYLSADFK